LIYFPENDKGFHTAFGELKHHRNSVIGSKANDFFLHETIKYPCPSGPLKFLTVGLCW
jgi:hypothetical protein